MKCLVTFKINGTTFSYVSTRQNLDELTLTNIVKELIERDNLKEYYVKGEFKNNRTLSLRQYLANEVKALLSKSKRADVAAKTYLSKLLTERVGSPIKKDEENYDDFKDSNLSIIGNSSLDLLEKRFMLDFSSVKSELDEQNEHILHCTTADFDNVGLGNVLNVQNLKIFLVLDKADAILLLSYLKSRLLIRSGEFDLTDISNDISDCLDYIRSKVKKASLTDAQVIKYFFNNTEKFLHDTTANGIDVYTTLLDFIKEDLLGLYVRKRYDDPFINTLIHRSYWSSYLREYVLTEKLMKGFISRHSTIPLTKFKLNEEGLPTEEEIEKTNKDLVNDLNTYFENASVNMKISVHKGRFYIKPLFQSIDSLNLTPQLFNAAIRSKKYPGGFYVYTIKDKYYVSKAKALTFNTNISNSFNTLLEAELFIAKLELFSTIYSEANIELMESILTDTLSVSVNVSNIPSKNAIIDIVKYTFPQYLYIVEKENNPGKYLISKANSNFLYGSASELKKFGNAAVFDYDYNKMFIFLVKASLKNIDLNQATPKQVKEIINEVSKLETSSYLVVTTDLRHKNITLFKLNSKTLEKEPTVEKKIPMYLILSNIADSINGRYRVLNPKATEDLVTIITESDLDSYQLEGANKIKGFIRNGRIFINSSRADFSDLYHEFGHLYLGMIKATNLQGYVELMNKLSERAMIKTAMNKLLTNPVYQNLALEDLIEEAFVDCLSTSIKDRISTFDNFFEKVHTEDKKDEEAIIKLINKTLDNLGTSLDYGNDINSIFKSFRSSMFLVINLDNGLSFNIDSLGIRKIGNRINKMISSGDIKKNC